MSLSAGQRLGPYEILSPIGAGGMGEVWRARDTRLGRDVALKVLPAATAADPGRRERFQREARALAALDHPNIVTVHSVEEAGGVHFLTMALVEGRTLDQVIPAGGLPLDRLLELALAARRRPGRRARQGGRPPRSQAREPDGHERRTPQGAGLRTRQAGRAAGHRRDDDRRNGRRDDRGDHSLHVPRAARGPAGRPPDRPVLLRDPSLRAGDGTASFPRGQPGLDPLLDPEGCARAGRRPAPRPPRGAGPPDRPLPREGSREEGPDRPGAAPRARARCARGPEASPSPGRAGRKGPSRDRSRSFRS